tara:strand:+ start:467782 stop:468000 length:219 start_codon:yes stop_codon:yes gene_type:complete
MTSARMIEHRITRDLLQRRDRGLNTGNRRLAERLIMATAVTAGMLMLGSYAPELLWALLAGAGVLTLGTRVS